MAARRRRIPETRRSDLIAAARQVFLEKGLANTTVGDIVKAAGVAQGTFYLYFASKDDIVSALAEEFVEGMVSAVEQATATTGPGALAKFRALQDAILSLLDDPAAQEVSDAYHRPENRAVHERMAERMAPRLAALVETIVAQGTDEGVFTVEDPHVAAWFVVGGLRMVDVGFTDQAHLPAAIASAMACALRALGCRPAQPELSS